MEIRNTKPAFDDKDFEIVEKCPWCEHENSKLWGSVKENERFYCVTCEKCNLIYVKKRFTEKALVKHYSTYFSSEHIVDEQMNRKRELMYKIEYDYISQFIDDSLKKRVLDIGCSGGMFLDYFKKDGFETYGVELGEEAANFASKKHKVLQGDFATLDFDKKFDLILFRGVIEHVANPKEYLKKSMKLLKNQGILVITSTPNIDCVCCEVYEDKWNQHLPEEHIIHFSVKHFNDFFSSNDFIKLSEKYFYEETPYADIKNDILKVADAIKKREQGVKIQESSPAFFKNLMSLIYQKTSKGN